MGRIVGIDFGTVRLGLAISDERQVIATPLKTITASRNPLHTVQAIGRALETYPTIDCLVLGLPLQLNGKEGPMALQVKAFGKLLEEQLHYPIVLWDERLTSAGVDKMLIGCAVSRKKRATVSDSLSAISILQNYLDALRFQKNT